jgi:hypothetical protein
LLLALLEKVVGDSVLSLETIVRSDISATEKLRLHILGVLNAFYRHPYLNRLIHFLLSSSEDTRRRISLTIVQPVLAAQTAILEQGKAAEEFRDVNPMSFYFHVIGACDHLFYGLYAMKYAFGISEMEESLKENYGEDLVRTILCGIAAKPG